MAYAGFIGDSPEYVINQLIETVLAKDREFVAWRGEGPPATESAAEGEDATPAASGPSGGPHEKKVMMRVMIAHGGVVCLALHSGTMPPRRASADLEAIDCRDNILISGWTTTGKTRLLDAPAAFLPGKAGSSSSSMRRTCRSDAPMWCALRREGISRPAVVDDTEPAARHATAPPARRWVRREDLHLLQALHAGHGWSLHPSCETLPTGSRARGLVRDPERCQRAIPGRPPADRRPDLAGATFGDGTPARSPLRHGSESMRDRRIVWQRR